MYRNDDINRIQFTSTAELADYVRDYRRGNMIEGPTGFFGGKTAAQTLDSAVHGDDSFVPEAQKLLDQMELEALLPSVVDEPDVVGCYPVAAEYLEGIPECMRMPTKVGSDHAPLSLFLDMTTSAGITAREYKNRGLAVLALVIALSSRRPIQLEIGCVMGCSKETKEGESVSLVSAVINTAPLDLATAAWALTDVSFARRLLYSASGKAHDFDGCWPRLKDVPYQEPQCEAHIKRVAELLDLPGETLYLPAVCIKDEDTTLAMTKPAEWVKKWFARYTKQIES